MLKTGQSSIVTEKERDPHLKILNIKLPLYGTAVSCGFTSPAEDYVERHLSLDEYCVSRPASTFFVRASGDSMQGAGIFDHDLLVVDRSIKPVNGHVVLAILNAEFTVKRLVRQKETLILHPENRLYPDIVVSEDMDFSVWGVVTQVVHKLI